MTIFFENKLQTLGHSKEELCSFVASHEAKNILLERSDINPRKSFDIFWFKRCVCVYLHSVFRVGRSSIGEEVQSFVLAVMHLLRSNAPFKSNQCSDLLDGLID